MAKPFTMFELKYLGAYPAPLQEQVRELIRADRLGAHLAKRYPERHAIQTEKALYTYTNGIRQAFLRVAPAIDKVLYDSKLDVLHHALGQRNSGFFGCRGRVRTAIRNHRENR